MSVADAYKQIIAELSQAAASFDDEETDNLVQHIQQAKKIFVAGAGRSGLMGKAFVMRMMHMGLDAYVIGETVTPNLQENDLLIICSGSGSTKSLIPLAEKAKHLGGIVITITINPDALLGKTSDFVVKLPGSPKEDAGDDRPTIQPMGSLFEQTLLLFCDAVILQYMKVQQLHATDMFSRHANLE